MDHYREHVGRDRSEDRAVAPVVGVTLLISITVILAAVIGTVVLSVGVGQVGTPEATLSFNVVDDEVVVIHEGGEPLRKANVVVRDTDGTEYELEDDIATGERRAIVDADGNALDLSETDVDRLTVVWQGDDSESIIATFRP